MTAVVDDVVHETDGAVDVLVITHEHWDHLSGFIQAAGSFAKLDVGAVWVAWTEDPKDDLARELGKEKEDAINALRLSAVALAAVGDRDVQPIVEDMIGFFGAAGTGTTRQAFDAAKGKGPVRFLHPSDAPIELPGLAVKVYVLGPPHDAKLIRRTLAGKGSSETYGLAFDGTGAMSADVQAALTAPGSERPFGSTYVLPTPVAQDMDFFRENYWGSSSDAWRRIDNDWLDSAADLALALDAATNNTSLVLAFEFAGGDVALLVGDAQVGNWESWQTLSWNVEGREVTGPDLLSRTTFYKVGHHGSHNATLRTHGLEAMKRLKTAAIPVNHEMAVKRRWGQMPLPDLVAALQAATNGRTLRTDEDPATALDGVNVDPLFFDIDL